MLTILRYWCLVGMCLLAGVTFLASPVSGRGTTRIMVNTGGMVLTVNPDGTYTITVRRPAWQFAGTVGSPVSAMTTNAGSDRIGGYRAIAFSYGMPPLARAEIRLYVQPQIVLFTLRYLKTGTAPVAFPVLSTYPGNLYHLGYRGHFALYTFGAPGADSPWLWFNQHDDAFILSPAANYLVASTTIVASGALAGGLNPAITQVPAGFTQRTILVVGHGINAAYDTWGRALTSLAGKPRPGDEATTELKYLGYWTDTGAAYYYRDDPAQGYEGTLLAVRQSFQRLGIPLGYLELDSWWYPKGPRALWQGSGFLRGGIYRYTADPVLFPDGLATFQRRLGLPLVVHARWIDAASPYRQRFRMSGNVIIDPRYWQQTAAYLRSAGVITYEQDWLGSFAQAALNLTDPPAFLTAMATAMEAQGISLQYCMPLPADLLQSTLYANLLTVRVSEDHFKPSHWTSALYDARLASALGIWPWNDVFMSDETDNLLLADLSAGIVGVGDPLGGLDAANLHRVMRGDGMLVKPDAPLVPTDATYLADAVGGDQPMVASTYSAHGAARTLYVFAYRRGASSIAAFQPEALGLPGPVYVYNYFQHQGKVLAPGASFRAPVGNGSYYLIAPIGRSGMALLGDLDRFVSMGRQRIAQVGDTGQIQAVIRFGAGETAVTISGYAPLPPLVAAIGGQVGTVTYDPASHLFQARIRPGTDRTATLVIREPVSG